MSRPEDDREGLSPPPQTLFDLLNDDGEDDDMYEPASEDGIEESTVDGEGEDDDDDDDDDDSEPEYTDAQESLSGIEIVFESQDEESTQQEEDGEETETEQPTGQTNTRSAQITINHLNDILAAHGPLRQLLLTRYRLIAPNGRNILGDDDDGDDDDESTTYNGYPRRRRRKHKPVGDRFPKVPSDAGRTLMSSGTYGTKDSYIDKRWNRRRTVSERLMWRRLGGHPRSSMRYQNRLIAQELVPSNSIADKIIHYDSRAYSGQFSDDGNFFFSCTQNFKVRMYDTSNPYDWKYYKTVDYPFGQWTITDATLSPDNRFLAYSSIRHMVCLAPTDPTDPSDHTLLDFTNFSAGAGRLPYGYMGRNGFGIWSLRFSGDGREIVAGTSDHSVVVYDVERRQSTVRLSNHEDDVNAVCFGDKMSPHILYSGSDDQTLRVWDRRSMADGREAGVFVGHTEGLTYVDSKGDGRYVLSNGKDQMMKLWDLRKMMSTSDFAKVDLSQYTTNFDYRFSPYDPSDYYPNPKDCSVVTFRGHSVLKTLIRCHFSPPNSSNSRYVYTGSEDGKVWVYNLDGTVKAKIDVGKATKNTRPKLNGGGDAYGYELGGHHSSTWKTCVRDASWSPTAPILAATSWNGWGMSTGTVSTHTWHEDPHFDEEPPNYDFSTKQSSDDALPPMGTNYNSRLDPREDFDQAAHRANNPSAGWNGSAVEEGRSREGGRGLRSRIVRPMRYGLGGIWGGAGDGAVNEEDEGGGGRGAGW